MDRNRTRIGTEQDKNWNWNWTKLETVILRMVLVIPEFECRTKFRNLGSQCEAVKAVLQWLMSSRGGTSAGGVTGLELAKVCQSSYVSVTGRNSIPPQGSRPRSWGTWMGGLWRANGVPCAAVGFERKAETSKSWHGKWRSSEQRSRSEALGDIKWGWRSEKVINSPFRSLIWLPSLALL